MLLHRHEPPELPVEQLPIQLEQLGQPGQPGLGPETETVTVTEVANVSEEEIETGRAVEESDGCCWGLQAPSEPLEAA